jgi:hypothetical protein
MKHNAPVDGVPNPKNFKKTVFGYTYMDLIHKQMPIFIVEANL